MRKQRFLVFLLSAAFGLSMIFYASNRLTAAMGQAPAGQELNQQCCPYYQGSNLSGSGSMCPLIQKYGRICPGLNGAASAGECPALRQQRDGAHKTAGTNYRIYLLRDGSGGPLLILKSQSHSSYILILTPFTKGPHQGKSTHAVRI